MKKIHLVTGFIFLSFSLAAQNIGIGAITPTAKLHIKGTADTTQLLIDAYSTQSNSKPLIKLRNSSGAELMRIHSDDTSNLFIGRNAGIVNDPFNGNYNTFIGSNAGYSNTTGGSNTACGKSALYSNTTGLENTANGIFSLSSNTSGFRNTAIGTTSLATNTTGNQNTAVGAFALWKNETANYNTAFGSSTGAGL